MNKRRYDSCMAYHPRIESKDRATFITTRTRNSELWFANNRPVEEYALAQLAKLCSRYRVTVYAFGLEGSHYHAVMRFELLNRADFTRDFNSGIARAVDRLTPNFDGGRLWKRRYSGEYIAGDPDIERQFFYTVLQPIQDHLVQKISEYPFYNCFHDATRGVKRIYKMVNWTAYYNARRINPAVKMKDFLEIHTLEYHRLPGYENFSQQEYRLLMLKKLEFYRQEILKKHRDEGKVHYLGAAALLKSVPGTKAKSPKISTRASHRPRVLSVSHERRAEGRNWYFKIYFKYKESSKRYRAGELEVEFPPGTYLPPIWMVVRPSGPYVPI